MQARKLFTAAALGFTTLMPLAHSAQPLQLEVFNPGEKSMFPVSSVIVSGAREAILIDAQFQRDDAEALVAKLRAGGKTLKAIYISHSDPDYYFGLDTLKAAFPAARVLATAQTVAHIKESMDGKLAYWGPILKQNAPGKLVLPEAIAGDSLSLEGQRIEIKGLTGPSPERSYLWIPSLKTVAGGVVVSSGIHVWVADTQSAQSRQDWQATLKGIAALQPAAVVPGHYLGEIPAGLGAVAFTAEYLKAFEDAAAHAKDSNELITSLKARYPSLGEPASLELSAKVIKGGMKWPQ
ncbi:MAG: MBL fold metallo-hydrolase [Candidatus Dactylopiibacterium carminicum]|uniref:MBL fold metallo-hydrolase n=1 Tax=Candidatus Dactylopiibacterium carminicum TaxID=857335 RepID=A0A272EXD2_9RHOO|nr:MBL fold metallo-hydrolase [Candidatus Dactylopiibacterium carminicum]KAF7600232.1 MBL fold metallo-hydrolase [Candidatus Dactylopiibacterium carminicum]PAS94751.1 MAG: MBL fold metallo-hydrolase [Candidatus Dactylopiibacterium carminicum]PAS97677.1 MAG: MBL fold metallo-hydrolase [Candidatus Dactylopiibacterium carminicum]PAT00226.1 MAG: MBL fold metallo-hydrolase [Candidatus Dactylopiibacterium carminicum]